VDQRSENSCGSHGFKDGKPLFDYTCDDCMLHGVIEPPDYGNEDNSKGISEATPSEEKRNETRLPDF